VKNKTVLDYEDGYVKIPTGPGLGIEIDEEAIRQGAKEGHKWRNPFWRHEDGSVAEW
jgi:galactonate dehydratase